MTFSRMLRFLSCGAVLVLAAVALTACGSSKSSAGSATTTTGSSTDPGGRPQGAALAKYTACLKQHGVSLPSFSGRPPSGSNRPSGGGGFPGSSLSASQRAKFQQAQSACRSDLPAGTRNGGFFGGGGGAGGFNSQAFAAYRNCLKLHGVTFTPGQRPSTASAKQQAAMKACAALRPARGGPPGAPTTTTPSN